MLQGRGREIRLSVSQEPREHTQRMSPGAVMADMGYLIQGRKGSDREEEEGAGGSSQPKGSQYQG